MDCHKPFKMLSLHNKLEVDDNPISRSYSCEVLQLRFSFIAADNKLLEVSRFLSKKGGRGSFHSSKMAGCMLTL